MKTFIVAIFIIFNIINCAISQDWCSLCADHIACNHPGTLSPSCPADAYIPPLTVEHVILLTEEHNKFRNDLAGGLVPGFSSASGMMRVGWDYELAYFARLNVMQCVIRHDSCRHTYQHRTAGQNLGGSYESDLSAAYRGAVKMWTDEYMKAYQSDITSCCGGDRFYDIGHFLQVAQDQAISIGCAAVRYAEGIWTYTLIACNYSHGNMNGAPVYRVGAPASTCPFGRDDQFTNLCKSSA